MSGISNNPNSPRQKMINLMYLVFIAMMAMNDTSSEVLSGFELVEKSLRESAATAADRNRKTLEELEAANRVNPTKVGEWYKKGVEVKKQAQHHSPSRRKGCERGQTTTQGRPRRRVGDHALADGQRGR